MLDVMETYDEYITVNVTENVTEAVKEEVTYCFYYY
jgi:hypothetical protein